MENKKRLEVEKENMVLNDDTLLINGEEYEVLDDEYVDYYDEDEFEEYYEEEEIEDNNEYDDVNNESDNLSYYLDRSEEKLKKIENEIFNMIETLDEKSELEKIEDIREIALDSAFLFDGDKDRSGFIVDKILKKVDNSKKTINDLFKNAILEYLDKVDQANKMERARIINETTLGELFEDVPEDIKDLYLPNSNWMIEDGIIYRFSNKDNEYYPCFHNPFFISKTLTDELTKESKLEIYFHNGLNWKTVVMSRGDMVNTREILKYAKFGFPVTSLNASTVVEFLDNFERRNINYFEHRIVTNRLGWKDDKLITSNGVFNGKDVVDDPDILYEESESNDLKLEIKKNKASKKIAKNVLPKMLRMNTFERTIPLSSWFMVSTISKQIRDVESIKHQFPLLNIWGGNESGKTTNADFMMRLIGNENEIQSIGTPFTTLKGMSRSNALPIIFDEYFPSELNPSHLRAFHDYLRSAYTRQVVKKGNKNQSQNTYKLESPICYIGEDTPTNNAIQDRSIVLGFSRSWLEENSYAKELYQEVVRMPIEKSAYSYWSFMYEYVTKGDISSDLEKCGKYIQKKFKHLPNRSQINSQIILFGSLLLRKYLKYIGVEEEVFTQKDVDKAIEFMNRHLTSEKVSKLDKVFEYFATYNNDFPNRDNNILVEYDKKINKTLLYIKEADFKTYIDIKSKINTDLLSKNRLTNELKENVGRANSYVLKIQYNKKMWGNKNPSRCIVIDIEKLSELTMVDKSSWEEFMDYDENDNDENENVIDLASNFKIN